MIKMRLVRLLSHAKKYIVYNVLWQWVALLTQVVIVFTITGLIEKVVTGSFRMDAVWLETLVLLAVAVIRFLCEKWLQKHPMPPVWM